MNREELLWKHKEKKRKKKKAWYQGIVEMWSVLYTVAEKCLNKILPSGLLC